MRNIRKKWTNFQEEISPFSGACNVTRTHGLLITKCTGTGKTLRCKGLRRFSLRNWRVGRRFGYVVYAGPFPVVGQNVGRSAAMHAA